jgi:hypothetical protein
VSVGPADLAVVACHFNPCSYRSREQNLIAFLNRMNNAEIPVFVAELILSNQNCVLPRAHNSITSILFRLRSVLRHKKRLLNLVV